MSLSSAMSAAMSGLTAASRMAEVISANIANAATPGYARRETQLGTHAESAGVSVLGIARLQDQALLADRRVATAEHAAAAGRRGFLETAEAALGLAEDAGGLTQRIADLDAAFLMAAAQPESEPLLAKAVQAAADLADRIADAARTISDARSAADTRIGSQIGTLNTSLSRVEDLNNRIMAVTAQGGDSSALQDRRQQEIDAIAQILPLREVDRGNGRIALFSAGGAALIDGQAAVFGFTPAKQMAPELSAGAGLSGLTLNGQAVDPAGRLMSGGSLATDFSIRDRLAPDVQQSLDMLAADLIARFSANGVDPTLVQGEAGLFTANLASDTPGLAQSLQINPRLDPAAGGNPALLRDGIGAGTPGPVGNPAQILRLHQALTTANATGQSAASHASALLSDIAIRRLEAEADDSFATARLSGLATSAAAQGVDSDRELQQLLLVEQAFSANARVLQVADDMIGTILGI